MKPVTPKASSVLSLALLLLAATALLAEAGLAQSTVQPKPKPKAQTQPQTTTQPPVQQQWISVVRLRIKPDMLDDYLDFVKKETLPALKKAGVKWRAVWQTATFGEGFEYIVVTPIDSFAQYDGQSPIVRALGEDGARDYLKKSRKLLSSIHTFAALERPDLSYEAKMTGPPKLAVVNIIHVAPGRAKEFESIVKNDVMPAMKKAGVAGYWVSQTVFGGNTNEYATLTLLDNFADLDKGSPLIRALGPAGFDRLVQKTTGIVVHQERFVSRYNAELSIEPAQAAEKIQDK